MHNTKIDQPMKCARNVGSSEGCIDAVGNKVNGTVPIQESTVSVYQDKWTNDQQYIHDSQMGGVRIELLSEGSKKGTFMVIAASIATVRPYFIKL